MQTALYLSDRYSGPDNKDFRMTKARSDFQVFLTNKHDSCASQFNVRNRTDRSWINLDMEFEISRCGILKGHFPTAKPANGRRTLDRSELRVTSYVFWHPRAVFACILVTSWHRNWCSATTLRVQIGKSVQRSKYERISNGISIAAQKRVKILTVECL